MIFVAWWFFWRVQQFKHTPKWHQWMYLLAYEMFLDSECGWGAEYMWWSPTRFEHLTLCKLFECSCQNHLGKLDILNDHVLVRAERAILCMYAHLEVIYLTFMSSGLGLLHLKYNKIDSRYVNRNPMASFCNICNVLSLFGIDSYMAYIADGNCMHTVTIREAYVNGASLF